MGSSGQTVFNNDSTNVVTTTATQTLTNKSLVDASTAIVDSTDATKQIKFDAVGTTGTSTTITSSQTANRTITLPDRSLTVGLGTDISSGAATSGQVLTANGSGGATWSTNNFGAGLYYGVFDNGSTTNKWTLTSATITDFTVGGTPTITQKYKTGFVTIGGAASNAPGITLTAPFTGTIEVIAHVCGFTSADNGDYVLTDGSNTILDGGTFHENAANAPNQMTLMAFYDVTASSSYTFKLRGRVLSGTLNVGGDVASNAYLLTFSVKYIK